MGEISVTFVAICTCMFLASQVPQTESASRGYDRSSSSINGDNGDLSPAPDARVTSLQCTRSYCKATVENDDTKYNGNDVTVHFTLQPSSDKLKNPLVSSVRSGSTVTIGLRDLDLLPFTNYTVTASLANSDGPATDPALTKQATFTTKSKRPGRVSCLAVTHATPSSLHVVWTAPDDHPPKGKLIAYKLQLRLQEVTIATKPVIVNESITSFNITGLEPSMTYEITIRAKNADTNGYGEAASITSTTTEEGEVDQPHINSTSGCVDDPPTRHTTTNHRPPSVMQPPPLPPPPPQVPAGSQQQQQQQHQTITSHYGRGIDHYGRAIDAYVAHLAFLETYLTQQTAQP